MGEKKRISAPAVGGSSLLAIFAVLCLTVLALLSVSTAQADHRLGTAAAQAVTDYYEADRQAEAILAEIRRGQVPQQVTAEDGRYAYSCPISDTQALFVEAEVRGSDYRILRWQVRSTADWQPDNALNLYGGQGKEKETEP